MITLSDDHVTDLQEAQRRYYYQDLGNFFAGREPALFATLSPEERLTFAYGA